MAAVYRGIVRIGDRVVPGRFRPLWEHPAGPKTVFFWAPAFKWGLVIGSIADIGRPADKISPSQTAALAATGVIWSRYSLVIIPKNWSLFSVNVFVAFTNLYQLYRVYQYRNSLTDGSKSSAVNSV